MCFILILIMKKVKRCSKDINLRNNFRIVSEKKFRIFLSEKKNITDYFEIFLYIFHKSGINFFSKIVC